MGGLCPLEMDTNPRIFLFFVLEGSFDDADRVFREIHSSNRTDLVFFEGLRFDRQQSVEGANETLGGLFGNVASNIAFCEEGRVPDFGEVDQILN